MKLEVVNWEKYNPRNDAKAWSWFRLQNDFFEDDEFFDLGQTELLLFVYLCCRRSKSASAVFGLNPRKAAHACRCEPNDILGALTALEQLGKVKVHEWKPDPERDVRPRTDTHVHVRERTDEFRLETDPYPTDGRTDVTNDTDDTKQEERAEALSPPKPARRTRTRALIPTFSDADLAVGREWLQAGLSEMPWKAKDPSWTAERFAEALAKLRRVTGITEAGLVEIQRYVAKDDFWRKNACSPAGLLGRAKPGGERKIDNILVRMRTKQHRALDTLQRWAEKEDDHDQA